MPGHEIRVGLVESPQVAADLQIEVRRLDVLGERRLIRPGGLTGILARAPLATAFAAGPGAAAPAVTAPASARPAATGDATATVASRTTTGLAGPRTGTVSLPALPLDTRSRSPGPAGPRFIAAPPPRGRGIRSVVTLAPPFTVGAVVPPRFGGPVLPARDATIASARRVI